MTAHTRPEVDPGVSPVDPLVTVSLVTFNGRAWLDGCLRSIAEQSVGDYELLVVDNGSSDDTAARLREAALQDGRVTVELLDRNLGYAAGHNRNIKRARGEFVCLVNQDIELEDAFIAEAVAAFRTDPRIGSVQGRLRKLERGARRTMVLDSTGLELHRDRRVVSRGQGELDGPRYGIPGPVWGADGPVPVYRHSALLDARVPRVEGGWEVLDEDFFMYKEDIDLAWRLCRLGWSAWYAPTALAWHGRGTGGRPGRSLMDLVRADRTIPRWVKAISWRNHRLMQMKNESVDDYLLDLPWIIKREAMSLAFMALADPVRLRVVADLIRALPSAMRKRWYVTRRARGREAVRCGRLTPSARSAAPTE